MSSFKARRKHSKYKQILKNDFNIEISPEPCQNLMIGNAGLVSGIQYEQLAKLFIQYGNIEKIVMIPRKSYSFVVYSSVNDAVKAYNTINGHVTLTNMDGPMYLLYTASVPTELDVLTSSPLPEGLVLLSDFVTIEEEETLLGCIAWDTAQQETAKTLKHRRVKHFGYEFRYDINNVDKDLPLKETVPKECSFIEDRLKKLGYPLPWPLNQLTVNEYQKGQGIPSHIDTHSAFESPILSLSLGSDVVMEFRKGEKHVSVLLPRCSLLIMDGESRYTWTHGITPRNMDVVTIAGGLSVRDRSCRTSFTLRRVREGPCCCDYMDYCDSQQSHIPDNQASRLEELYVHKVYNSIYSHFSETRIKVWPNVQEFLRSFSPGSVVIDAGCGNGKYFGVNPTIFQVGFDHSSGLAEITRSRGYEVFVSNCLSLPLRQGTADGIICIAVLHHLSTRERRLCAIREMKRVLVSGGRALITVWARDQTKNKLTAYLKQDRKNRKRDSEDLKVPNYEKAFSNMSTRSDKCDVNSVKEDGSNSSCEENRCLDFQLPIHTARTEFQHQDVFVPWKVKSKDTNHQVKETFLRYYHVFEENELSDLCSAVTDINILQTYYTEGNWCIIFQKVKS